MSQYGIQAEVWSGVTGHRISWCKRGGEIELFSSQKEAEFAAEQYMKRTQGNPYRVANFRYIAMPYRDARR